MFQALPTRPRAIIFILFVVKLSFFFLLQQERENPNMAVYANVTELKKLANRVPPTSTSTCSSPGLPLSPAPDSPQWEERPGDDQDSGKMFYPAAHRQSPTLPAAMDASALLSPAPSVSAPSSLPPTVSQGSDWEQLVDDNSGRPYYFSATLNQTSWDAPEPISPQPERLVRNTFLAGLEENTRPNAL